VLKHFLDISSTDGLLPHKVEWHAIAARCEKIPDPLGEHGLSALFNMIKLGGWAGLTKRYPQFSMPLWRTAEENATVSNTVAGLANLTSSTGETIRIDFDAAYSSPTPGSSAWNIEARNIRITLTVPGNGSLPTSFTAQLFSSGGAVLNLPLCKSLCKILRDGSIPALRPIT